MPHESIERVFQRYRDTGDPQALAQVFDRTAADLLPMARHLAPVGVEAEDLVQATFLTAMEAAAEFDSNRRLLPWLTGILANHARKARRRRRPHPATPRETADPDDPLQRAEAAELRDSLIRCVDAIPEPYRPVLSLYVLHGFSPVEIASTLGRSRPTVRSQIYRGLELLRRGLPAGLAGATTVAAVTGRGLASVRQAVLAKADGGGALGASALDGSILVRILGGIMSLKKSSIATVVLIGTLALWWAWPGSPLLETSTRAEPSAPSSVRLTTDASTRNEPVLRKKESERESVSAPPAEAMRTPDAPSKGALLVRLVREVDGQPVPGRMIGLLQPHAPDSIRWFPVREQRTGADGTALFDNLAPAAYGIRPDLMPDSPHVAIEPGQRTETTLTVPLGVTVEGRVVDGHGNPVPGAAIYMDTGWTSHTRAVAVADAAGRFQIPDVSSGYRLGAMADGFAPSHHHPVEAAVGERETITMVMSRAAATLRGVVLAPDGNPIPRAFVAIQPVELGRSYRDEEGRFWRPAQVQVLRADANGTFTTNQAPAERVIVVGGSTDRRSFMPAREDLDLAAGGERYLELRTGRGAVIEGTVSRGGAGVAGVEVHALSQTRHDSPIDADHLVSQFDPRSAYTDDNGRYRISGLRPGNYRLSASGLDPRRTPHSITLHAGESYRQDLTLVHLARLRVRLVDPTDAPLENWRVTVHYRSVWPSAVSDAKGEVTFEGFDAGEYTVLVETPSDHEECHHRYVALGVEGLAAGEDIHTIRVAADKLPTARIRARILDAQGRVPATARLAIDASVLGRPQWGSVGADDHGDVVTGLLPPGTYRLTVRARDYRSIRLPERQLGPHQILDLGEIRLEK